MIVKVEVEECCGTCKHLSFEDGIDESVCKKTKEVIDEDCSVCDKWKFEATIMDDWAYCTGVAKNAD